MSDDNRDYEVAGGEMKRRMTNDEQSNDEQSNSKTTNQDFRCRAYCIMPLLRHSIVRLFVIRTSSLIFMIQCKQHPLNRG